MCAAPEFEVGEKKGLSFGRYGEPDAPGISKHSFGRPTLGSGDLGILHHECLMPA